MNTEALMCLFVLALMLGAGGENRGIWDVSKNEWTIYWNGNNNLIINDLSTQFIHETINIISSVRIAANGYTSGSKSISKSGWRPFGIVGCDVSNRYVVVNRMKLGDINYGSGTIDYMVSNHHSSEHSTTASVRVLWIRA